ncbi:hypothetical protein L2E47_28565, partial [Pseudomonas aeruginosa]|nr:hypothetical protein [Pseudomonas aeruginosa]
MLKKPQNKQTILESFALADIERSPSSLEHRITRRTPPAILTSNASAPGAAGLRSSARPPAHGRATVHNFAPVEDTYQFEQCPAGR